jgi:hypothetical protein
MTAASTAYPRSYDTPSADQWAGQVGGASNVWQAADAALVRPANTTAYSAGEAIGSSTTVLIKFTGFFFRARGGSALLTGLRLVAQGSGIAVTNMGAVSAHLYTAPPASALATATADQTQYNTMYADDTLKLGRVDFATWNIGGGSGSDTIESYGAAAVSPLPLIAGQAAQDLYMVLAATGAFTPLSAQLIGAYAAAVMD